MRVVTCVAPVNIAVIKYWGKRNEDLILPLNDSLSTTLSTEHLCAKTSVTASPDFTEDRIWLNGKEENIQNPRVKNCLTRLRQLAMKQEGGSPISPSWKVHICSENNFPTAAGLASSAAGYACLVFTLAELYGISGEISHIARQGSGSACRSVYGGLVRWHAGTLDDGSDSIATQVVKASHWPELRILILVVSDHKKKISSTSGMQQSVLTSALLKHRVQNVVPNHITCIEKAIQEKDFQKFGEITMKDSNQFHAICLDTYPPAVYMNDTSHKITHIVHHYNSLQKEVKVAYTFDAGPNACLYLLESEVSKFIGVIDKMFPTKDGTVNELRGLQVDRYLPQEIEDLNVLPHEAGSLQYLILTKLGNGPHKLEESSGHLIDSSGLPLVK